MRVALALFALIISATAALAADWQRYENGRFGYVIEVPAGFVAQGDPPANDDGRVFVSRDGSHLLRVYGGYLVSGDFADSVGMAMSGATDVGWDLSYKRVTGNWASYSGTRDGRILYARAIAICGGTAFASYEFEYPKDDDRQVLDQVIKRLNRTLKPSGGGLDC